jgi:hypothetical protein
MEERSNKDELDRLSELEIQIKLKTLEKLNAEISEIGRRSSTYETVFEKRWKFVIGVVAPLATATLAVVAAYISFHSQGEVYENNQSKRIVERLTHADHAVRLSAIASVPNLSQRWRDEALDTLVRIALFKNDDEQLEAEKALVAIGGDRTASYMEYHATSEDLKVATAALEIIGRIRARRSLPYLLSASQMPYTEYASYGKAGRATGILAYCYSDAVAAKIRELRSTGFDNDIIPLLDAAWLLDDASVNEVLRKLLASYFIEGRWIGIYEYEIYIRMLFQIYASRATVDVAENEMLAYELMSKSNDNDSKVISAIYLLKSNHDREAREFLMTKRSFSFFFDNAGFFRPLKTLVEKDAEIASMILSDILEEAEKWSQGVAEYESERPDEGPLPPPPPEFRARVERGLVISSIEGLHIRESLLEAIANQPNNPFYIVSAIILFKQSPSIAKRTLAFRAASDRVRTLLLAESDNDDDKLEAIKFWSSALVDQKSFYHDELEADTLKRNAEEASSYFTRVPDKVQYAAMSDKIVSISKERGDVFNRPEDFKDISDNAVLAKLLHANQRKLNKDYVVNRIQEIFRDGRAEPEAVKVLQDIGYEDDARRIISSLGKQPEEHGFYYVFDFDSQEGKLRALSAVMAFIDRPSPIDHVKNIAIPRVVFDMSNLRSTDAIVDDTRLNFKMLEAWWHAYARYEPASICGRGRAG